MCVCVCVCVCVLVPRLAVVCQKQYFQTWEAGLEVDRSYASSHEHGVEGWGQISGKLSCILVGPEGCPPSGTSRIAMGAWVSFSL